MSAYLIKSILCLLVLWGFYKIALEQTAAHRFKRIYLLGCLIVSLTLPLLTFSYTVEMATPDVVETANTYYPTETVSNVEPAAIIQKVLFIRPYM